MPKEPKPNFASFTKAELVKTVKKLDARQTKLLNEIAQLKAQLAYSPELLAKAATREPGPYDVVHVTQGPDTVSELVPEATPEDWRHKGEVAAGKPAFPWEKD